ncbi:hypothetical protein H0H81_010707 [Sphagnurus paluster]|uniref:DNA mismatch repair protein MutS core domain-containing protein n=1 Tax=Sphagnurus paluster TaxID=117069 RepID=A0A9P7FUS9_9AGAR|nr:hypothetical protein H0H81_010707 [Sphagnurus paluster]
MASIGALLDYITRQRAVGNLDDEGIGGLDVRYIELLSLDKVLQINSDALLSVIAFFIVNFADIVSISSLQIFENESHASIYSDKTKEGLSLFGENFTLGKSLLRTWLLRPSLSIDIINKRHDAVECFLRPDNIVPAGVMRGHLKGIKNVPRILGILKTGRAKLSDWQGLVKIDWEESATTGRVCVRPNIDEELDNRKHVYNGIDSVLDFLFASLCWKNGKQKLVSK